MLSDEKRFQILIDVCQVSEFSLDVLEVLTRGVDIQALLIFCGNVSTLPKNKKSKDVP